MQPKNIKKYGKFSKNISISDNVVKLKRNPVFLFQKLWYFDCSSTVLSKVSVCQINEVVFARLLTLLAVAE